MWNAIYRKLWLLILLPLLAGGIAWFFSGRKAGQYRSVAVIEASVPDHPAGARTLKEIPEPDEYYESMVQTMKTEVVTSMASYRLLLHDLEKDIAFRPPAIQYSPPKRELIRTMLEKKLSSFELLSESDPTEQTIFRVITNTDYNLARWIRDGQITIERRPGTNDIEVACSTEDPFLSAFAANAISQEYIRYETGIASPPSATGTQGSDSLDWYRDEVDRLRKDLERKNSDLNEAGAKSPAGTDDMTVRRAKANKISEFEMKVLEEEWEVANLREQLARMERPEPGQERQAADIAANAKIKTITKKIDQLSKIYLEGGSKDRQLDSIITRLRQQLNDETFRLETASQRSTASVSQSVKRNRDMITARIRRHEDNIRALKNDIWRLKNTKQTAVASRVDVTRLRHEREVASEAYNNALAKLRKAESKQPIQFASGRSGHHLILKEKALPSAEPESPWALAFILVAVIGTLAVCLIVIALTRPAPAPYDDIFLKVNYSNRRASEKKKHPREEDVSDFFGAKPPPEPRTDPAR